MTTEEAKTIKDEIKATLEDSYQKSKNYDFALEEWETKEWEEIKVSEKFGKVKDTGVNIKDLKEIGEKITALPKDWDFHP